MGSFDNVEHNALLRTVGNFPARELIKQWLKAGYVEEEMLHPTETGTPQGGVVSPLLLNIALHGMERALGIEYDARGRARGPYALVRFADDLAVFARSRKEAETAKRQLAKWLAEKGLSLSEEKTRIRHLSEGFNFLGFTIRHYPAPNSSRSGYKLLITPSRESIQRQRHKLKGLWRKHVGTPTAALIKEMNPVIRGWGNYFRSGVAKKVFNDLDRFMYHRAKRYAQRRHPNKSGKWRMAKYWGKAPGPPRDRWVFKDRQSGACLHKFAWIGIERHRMVPRDYSPDNPDLSEYWRERRARTAKRNRRYRQLFKRQHGLCPVCRQHLESGEETHTHHVIPKKSGGTDDLANLRLVHVYCHHQIHSTRAPLEVRRLLEPSAR